MSAQYQKYDVVIVESKAPENRNINGAEGIIAGGRQIESGDFLYQIFVPDLSSVRYLLERDLSRTDRIISAADYQQLIQRVRDPDVVASLRNAKIDLTPPPSRPAPEDKPQEPVSNTFSSVPTKSSGQSQPSFQAPAPKKDVTPANTSSVARASGVSRSQSARKTTIATTLPTWLQTAKVDGHPHIDGWALYRKTMSNFNAKNTAESAGIGCLSGIGLGLFAIFNGGWMLGGIIIVMMIVEPMYRNLCLTTVLIAGIVGGLFWYFTSSEDKRQSRGVVWNDKKRREETQRVVDELGVRRPTSKEYQILTDIRREIDAAAGTGLKPPFGWYISNEQGIFARPVGDAVIISRQAVLSDYIAPLIAHAWARCFMGDGIIQLGLDQLMLPERMDDFPYQNEWVSYWRQQVYIADQFTTEVGYGQQLIAYLEYMEPLEGSRRNIERYEPYHAERIDRLYMLA